MQNSDAFSENVDGFLGNIDAFSRKSHRDSFRSLAPFIDFFNFGLVSIFSLFYSASAFKIILIPALHAAAGTFFRFAESLQIILLLPLFFISSLKKVLCNRLICGTFSIFHDFLSSFGRSAPWRRERLQRPHSGAILILLALFIPIVLGGIKYSEYLFERRFKLIEAPGPIQKKCAAEAALAVAQNWNPGLTLAQQQEAFYKIADAIYNSIPSEQTSVLGAAIPGLKGTQDYGAI